MENSRWTGKVPQLRFAFAPCARSKSGLVLVPGRPLLLCLRGEPPFFRSCDCTSERTAEEVDPTEFIDGTARCVFVRKCFSKKHFPPCLCLPTRANVVSGRQPMPDHSYILFNKSPLQLRSLGARGGRAYGRNLRPRRALLPTPPAALAPCDAPRQTTAQAIALLDSRFPWLRCAEKRRRPRL